ncbi:MAG: hypothetical protein V1763_01250 [Parcubacteria group bacterium]
MMFNQKKFPWRQISVIAILVVLVFAGVAFMFWNPFQKAVTYQAVFLANGQVYFGRATHLNGDYVKLTDIYYLQVQSALQPATTTDKNKEQLMLMKLGNELHGPLDKMLINREQISFIEDLRSDSRVVAAIAQYKATNK